MQAALRVYVLIFHVVRLSVCVFLTVCTCRAAAVCMMPTLLLHVRENR